MSEPHYSCATKTHAYRDPHRETIDAIAAQSSAICRGELEAALEQQAEISDHCKQEIQQILLTMSDRFTTAGYEGKPESPPVPVEKPLIHPAIWVAVAVVVFFAAAGAYIVYVNSLMEHQEGKEKKLSKKKVCSYSA